MFDDWRLRRYPELAVCDTPVEQEEVLQVCSDRVYGAIRIRLVAGGILVVTTAALVIRSAIWPALNNAWPAHFDRDPPGLALAIIAGLFLYLAHRALVVPRLESEIRRELAGRGYRVCVHCGYDLRAQAELRCPECGLAFVPPEAKTQSDPPIPESPED